MIKGKMGNILPASEIKEFDRWTPPPVSGIAVNADQIRQEKRPSSIAVKTPVTAQNLEEIRKSAYQDGLAEGKVEGKQIAINEQQQVLNQLNTLLSSCHDQMENFEQSVCDQLVELCITISKQVIRQELKSNPEQIMAVVQESIIKLPSNSKNIIIKLHPDDAVIVKELYQLSENTEQAWKIIKDPELQRGGCIVKTETSMINAELDHRIELIVSRLLGETTDE